VERILSYRIKAEENTMKIEHYLRHLGYSRQNLVLIKKMPESIRVNGIFQYMNQRLYTGDLLTVHIQENTVSENIQPVYLPLDIIYEDEDIIVVNKPAGMPTHPSMNNRDNSLANALAWYFKEQHKDFIFRCTNRLDRDTSGLTIISKHLVSASIMFDMASSHLIEREYLAIVHGQVSPDKGTIDAPLSRKPGSIIERFIDFTEGEKAITHYRLLAYKNGHSLISLHLETGRTHQIRIHMKYLGYPLIGDYLYNPDMHLIKRQALHSYRMSLNHPMTGEKMTFTAPLPEDMSSIISLNESENLPELQIPEHLMHPPQN
jgi:23S rRNA pseudouridine1911/1915/1917 synthase